MNGGREIRTLSRLSTLCVLFWMLAAAACGGDIEPTVDLAADDDGTAMDLFQEIMSEEVGGLGCPCLHEGLFMRWTLVDIREPSDPEALPAFLNHILQPDVDAFRSNILLRVDQVLDLGAGRTELQLTVGPGWHDLTPDDVLPVQGGESIPTWFVFQDDYTTTIQATVEPDCRFTTGDDGVLWFHFGTLDHSYMCSPANPASGLPRDTLPFERVAVSGRFNDTCTRIDEGLIDSCILADKACELCLFTLSPDSATWKYSEDPTVDPVVPCTADFCRRWCGYSEAGAPIWTNFGRLLSDIGVARTCSLGGTEDDAYRIVMGFEAEKAVQGEGRQAPRPRKDGHPPRG